ncbi:S24 family peptidase [Achromobacter xylosoxidans]|uniref:S24 family peptidase n=1 Tax=Alcaligenes xylosoxydans xylosoxydans TaxID=85698 RepID=UPI00138E5425|nr:helix-turn-helix transcriptional regulator [Achromobacter xylosoxidans]
MRTTLAEVRRLNLRRLIDDEMDGMQSRIKDRTGISLSQIGQWLSGDRNMSETSARKLEAGLRLDEGWLDRRPGEAAPTTTTETAAIDKPDDVFVPISNATGSMGFGSHRNVAEQIIDTMRVTRSWIAHAFPNLSAIDNLGMLTAFGDSMEPTFSDGDLVLVDRGITEIKLDAVYVIARGDELFIKRVRRQLHDGAILIQSDNPLFGPPEKIIDGERDSLTVLGRVIWAWRGKKL